MSKAPGFSIGIPKNALLSEIDASLEKAFADFHQQACKTVRKLISIASVEELQADDKMLVCEGFAPQLPSANDAFWDSSEPSDSLREHLPTRVWDNFTEFSPGRAEPNLTLPPLEKNYPSDAAKPQDCKLILSAGHHHGAVNVSNISSEEFVALVPAGHPTIMPNFIPEEPEGDPISMPLKVARLRRSRTQEPEGDTISMPLKGARLRRSRTEDPEGDTISMPLKGSRLRRSRTSISSEEDAANLRIELDLHHHHHGTLVKKSRCSAMAYACHCNQGFEPKDLHFDQLAGRRGKLWKDLSLSDQVNIITEELTRSSCIIDPQSDWMKMWDILVICCLLFTVVVCPYEMAFLETEFGFLYLVNHTIDIVFLADMVMQFFLKVRIHTRERSIWLRNRRKIGIAYLKSWFVVDFLSVVPYDDISILVQKYQLGGSGLEHLKFMRLLRVLRLLKLCRMLKASRLVKRWENRNGLPSSTKHLIKCFLLILASIHWMACIWGFLGRWQGSNLKCRSDLPDHDPLVQESPTASWYIETDQGWSYNNPSAWRGQSWIVAFASGRAASNPIDPCSHMCLYVVSIYWAVMTMTSIGYGDILPQTVAEYVINSMCMIASGIFWAYIIGVASSVLVNSYPEIKEFEQKMDAFNSMVKELQVPTQVKLRGREFIRESRYKAAHERNLRVIQSLGLDLQAHLSKQSARLYLSNIRLFSVCSELFRADCAAQMLPQFLEPHYILQPNGQLGVVQKGAIGHEGRVLVPFNHWGEDFIITNVQLRSQSPAIALNYTLIVSLTRESFESVLINHPQERYHVRRRALCMAFRGAMRIYLCNMEHKEIHAEHEWIHLLLAEKSASSFNPLVTKSSASRLISLPKFDQNRKWKSDEPSVSKSPTEVSSGFSSCAQGG